MGRDGTRRDGNGDGMGRGWDWLGSDGIGWDATGLGRVRWVSGAGHSRRVACPSPTKGMRRIDLPHHFNPVPARHFRPTPLLPSHPTTSTPSCPTYHLNPVSPTYHLHPPNITQHAPPPLPLLPPLLRFPSTCRAPQVTIGTRPWRSGSRTNSWLSTESPWTVSGDAG